MKKHLSSHIQQNKHIVADTIEEVACKIKKEININEVLYWKTDLVNSQAVDVIVVESTKNEKRIVHNIKIFWHDYDNTTYHKLSIKEKIELEKLLRGE